MKNILFVIAFFPLCLFGQLRADQLPEITDPAGTDAFYSAERGSFRKIKLSTLSSYFTAGAVDTMISSNDSLLLYTTSDTFFVDLSGYDNTASIPTLVSELTNDSGFLTTEVDGSISNEIQTISIDSSGTSFTITLSNGGGSVIFEDSAGGTTQTIDTFSLNGTSLQLSLSDDGEPIKTVNLSGIGGGGSGVTSSDALNATILSNIALYGIAPVYSTAGGVFTEASTTDNTTLHQFYVKGASGSPTILGAGTVSITATFSYTVGTTYYLTDTGTLATSADSDGDTIDYISAAVYCVQSLGGNDYILNLKDPVHFVNN